PFMAVYTPSLMLQDGGAIAAQFGYPVEVIYIVAKTVLAIGLWGVAVVGYLLAPASLLERLAAFGIGVVLMLALPLADEIGFLAAALFIGQHWWRTRRRHAATVP